jgi:type VI secretion system protein ImpF
MPRPSLLDKLQPSLLDRLTDEHPERKTESPSDRVLKHEQYRQAVIRDLGWLLNSTSLETRNVELAGYEWVRKSVVNYGMPIHSGQTASSVDTVKLEKDLRKVIEKYEPRIDPKTLRIRVESKPEEMNQNSLVFNIEGDVLGQPAPFEVVLRSEMDLETGEIDVREDRG